MILTFPDLSSTSHTTFVRKCREHIDCNISAETILKIPDREWNDVDMVRSFRIDFPLDFFFSISPKSLPHVRQIPVFHVLGHA